MCVNVCVRLSIDLNISHVRVIWAINPANPPTPWVIKTVHKSD